MDILGAIRGMMDGCLGALEKEMQMVPHIVTKNYVNVQWHKAVMELWVQSKMLQFKEIGTIFGLYSQTATTVNLLKI